MNKGAKKITLIVFILIITVIVLSSCNANNTARFEHDYYQIYMDKDTDLVLKTIKMPKYTLSSSNPSIVEVQSDNKTIKALRGEGIVTITASYKDKHITTTVMTFSRKVDDAPPIPSDKYTVTFHTMGKSGLPNQLVNPGKTVMRPASPQHADHVIADWYTEYTVEKDDDGNELIIFSPEHLFNFDTKITADITLYAYWVLKGQPSFKFIENKDGDNKGIYIAGLSYPNLEYEHIDIPTTDSLGNEIIGIAKNAFDNAKGNINFKYINIPANIKIIDERAFVGCNKLLEVTFADNSMLTTIAKEAFKDCSSLTSVNFGTNSQLSIIADGAFQGANKLKDIELPTTLSQLGAKAFLNCTSLTAINLPSLLTLINNDTFNNTGLITIDLQYVERVASKAFYQSKELSTIKNTNNIQLIYADSLEGTKWFKSNDNRDKDGAIYLADILLYYYKDTANFEFSVKRTTRLIASNAFPQANMAVRGGIVRFTTEHPPIINSYALNARLFIVINPEYLSNYTAVQSINSYKNRFYYSDDLSTNDYAKLNGDLRMLVKYSDKNTSNIIIVEYKGDAVKLDLTSILYDRYGSDMVIDKICKGAFNKQTKLITLYLPAKINFIEQQAFFGNSALIDIHITGEWGDFIPANTNLDSKWYDSQKDPIIYVPASRLSTYKSRWSTYAKLLLSYED